jgi:NAD(P)-dependent dehydrogenase (short-subunit alcohol dehydrogenase family)
VIISSVYAFVNGAGALPYSMSKAAVAQLGRGLAVELAPHRASAMTAYFALLETDMIGNGVDAHPEVAELLSLTPNYLLKRIDPTIAATAIADGLEGRAQRVVTPRRWRPLFALQGIAGPALDRKNARTPAMHAALTKLDTRDLPAGAMSANTIPSTHTSEEESI